jgi:hypothetical protein
MLRPFLSLLDTFVLSSVSERLPLTILEEYGGRTAHHRHGTGSSSRSSLWPGSISF